MHTFLAELMGNPVMNKIRLNHSILSHLADRLIPTLNDY